MGVGGFWVVVRVDLCSLDQINSTIRQKLCSYDCKDMEGLAQVVLHVSFFVV